MSKVAITGGAGFLGSHLADRLIAQGHEVTCVDNLIGGYIDNVPKSATFVEFDCRDREAMARLLEGVDVVYHCAAAAYEGLSVFSPQYINEHTYMTTVSLLSAAAQAGVKRFVYLSSMSRYGAQQTPFTEDMPTSPEDPYAIAKVASEMQVKNICETFGIEYVIAVPHNIIGPRQKYDDPYRNVASIMVNRMLQGQPPIIYGDGEQKRCFSFVQDVVDPLARMMTEGTGETINVGPDEEFVTINELASLLSELTGFTGEAVHVKDRPREVKLSTCSADKARRLLDYKTTTTLREGLQSIVDYVRERGVKPFDYNIPLEINNDLTPETWKKQLI